MRGAGPYRRRWWNAPKIPDDKSINLIYRMPPLHLLDWFDTLAVYSPMARLFPSRLEFNPPSIAIIIIAVIVAGPA